MIGFKMALNRFNSVEILRTVWIFEIYQSILRIVYIPEIMAPQKHTSLTHIYVRIKKIFFNKNNISTNLIWCSGRKQIKFECKPFCFVRNIFEAILITLMTENCTIFQIICTLNLKFNFSILRVHLCTFQFYSKLLLIIFVKIKL